MDGHGVHVLPVHKQRAVGHIVGAQQKVHQRGLACAGLADDADALAGLDGERYVLQHVVLAVWVAERQMAELNAAVRVAQVGDASRSATSMGASRSSVMRFSDALPREVFSISIEMAMMGQTMASK